MAFRYEELDVCKDIRTFIKDIYQVTVLLPDSERYGITSQLRRAATSILLNIAEGSARRTPKEFSKFITYALGSLMECHAGLQTAQDLGFISESKRLEFEPKIQTIWKRLCALRNSQQA